MKAFAVLAAGLLLAAPAVAQTSGADGGRPSDPANEPAANRAASDEDGQERRICRRVETNTGSRVPFRRVCMTERQWEAYRRQN